MFPFLQEPKKGWYGYRRRVPIYLQNLFQGTTEIIQALNTRSHDIALIQLAKTNEWFDKRVTTNGYTNKKSRLLPGEQLKDILTDPEVIRDHIMNADSVNPPPTWQNVLDTYLRYNLRKRRNPEQAVKHQRAAVAMANKLGTAFPQLMDTPLVDIEQHMIEDFCDVSWLNASTLMEWHSHQLEVRWESTSASLQGV